MHCHRCLQAGPRSSPVHPTATCPPTLAAEARRASAAVVQLQPLPDVTPATLAELVAVVGAPAALRDAPLQAAAMSMVAALLSDASVSAGAARARALVRA
jgi:hypothetical protein